MGEVLRIPPFLANPPQMNGLKVQNPHTQAKVVDNLNCERGADMKLPNLYEMSYSSIHFSKSPL